MHAIFYHLRFFRTSFIVSGAALALVFALSGAREALVVLILAILEVSLSFENAVINAGILRRMSAFWQTVFLTVGILVAVAGMRFILPIVIVMVTAGLKFMDVVNLALHHPAEYGAKLAEAHPLIAAFGGLFLLMIFLDFLLDESKHVHWLERLERPLARAGRLKTLSTLIALIALAVVSWTVGEEESGRVLVAGITGLATYLLVRGLSRLFENMGGVNDEIAVGAAGKQKKVLVATGKAAFFLFLYLEVLDASFSFDGVVGAFAITSNVWSIAAGLGIGALFVRSITVWLVRHDSLKQFVYLEHGAHYAVGSLAVLLAASLVYEVPDVVTGLIGAVFIVLAVVSSVAERRQKAIKA